MADGRAIDRAEARGGVDGGLNRLWHAPFIFGHEASSKRKVQRRFQKGGIASNDGGTESANYDWLGHMIKASLW